MLTTNKQQQFYLLTKDKVFTILNGTQIAIKLI